MGETARNEGGWRKGSLMFSRLNHLSKVALKDGGLKKERPMAVELAVEEWRRRFRTAPLSWPCLMQKQTTSSQNKKTIKADAGQSTKIETGEFASTPVLLEDSFATVS